MERIAHRIETHPALGFVASFVSVLSGWFVWFVEHADSFAKVFGLAAAIFGSVAGWYSMRVMRRSFRRGETRPPLDPERLSD